MSKKQFGEYFLGLDIGTNSVGWAVTDPNYNLLKFNRKTMWGIRLFDEAKTAEDRRMHRSARRRRQRTVNRLELLQEFFDEEICKVDPDFFQRMKDSNFYQEDKEIPQQNTLFNDQDYKDKDFHKDFPTIYHLRKALIEGEHQYDVRLVYLAVHHILKHRGHFLFQGQSLDEIKSFDNVYEDLRKTLYDEMKIELECSSLSELEDILKDRNMTITRKKSEFKTLFGKEQELKEIINLLSGGSVKLSNIFPEEDFTDAEVKDIKFSDAGYEDKLPALHDELQEKAIIIEKIKAVYDWGILAAIVGDEPYLSFAKVHTYERHKSDLVILKRITKEICPDKYKEIFKTAGKKLNNYSAYVGVCNDLIIENKCTQDDFCKYLVGIFKGKESKDADFKYMMSAIENGTFAPKQTSKDNSTIPYQIHLTELKKILDNASIYLNFLNEKDDAGISVKEKIESIMTFRIPYYIGPLNDAHKDKENGFAWIVKRKKEKIYPWNFEDVVDVHASAEQFIVRMTSKCSYLVGKDVLPKNSLLYSKFTVLNELNNLKIDAEPISVTLKQQIYNDLFKKYKKVTGKRLETYLKQNGILFEETSGYDMNFKSSLSSFIDMEKILGTKISDITMVEDIIKSIVLFGDDKKILRSKINNNYGDKLSPDEIKKICVLRYTGWGRLSKEFLEEIEAPIPETGEVMGIIRAMWETNDNLMELLSNRYGYMKAVDAANSLVETKTDISYKMVEDLYVSPSVKRALWQTLKIVKEIKKVTGHEPKRVFVEMARGADDSGRTKSRKTRLTELYSTCKNEERDWIKELDGKTDNQLRSDRLYLYYTQMGKCMYSGEAIDLSQLFNTNIYDIDHIYPQSKTKDDSLDNRVLVKKDINAKKSDEYPLPEECRKKQFGFWKMLNEKGFISKKKYERLVRNTPLSEQERADFIARQLVETRQTTKAVATILKKAFKDTDIVYSKAGNVSSFRHDYGMLKCRVINDYHHAKDAYLNIVVGNVYHVKFTSNPFKYVHTHEYRDYNLNRVFDYDVKRGEETAWIHGSEGTINLVRQTMSKNNILFTRYATENKGGLFDQMLMKKGKGQVPIKQDPRYDIKKYGGYNKAAGAYFFLVEHKGKKGKVRTIETMPVYLAGIIGGDKLALEKYCREQLGMIEPSVRINKIKINALFSLDGFRMHVSGRTGNRLLLKGATQLVLDKDIENAIKKIESYAKNCKKENKKIGEVVIDEEFDRIDSSTNMIIYDALLKKIKHTVYREKLSSQIEIMKTGRDSFANLSVEEQSVEILEILHLFECTAVAANLKRIGGAASAGIVLLSKDITNSNLMLINQSSTGLFEQRIDLLTI